MTLSESVPYLVEMTPHYAMKPVYKDAVEKFGEKWTLPANYVSNGAYKLKDWIVNERIVLERNPEYWDNAKTIINKVTFLPISSEVTDVNRYRTGEIDMTYNNMPIELFQKLKKRSRKRCMSILTCAPITTKSTTRRRRSPMRACVKR